MIATPVSSDSLLHAAKSFQSAPQILAELGRLLSGLRFNVATVTALLKRHGRFAESILQISNSGLINDSGGAAHTNLEEAVAGAGFTEIYRLSGFATIICLPNENLSAYGLSGTQMRENALFTALLAEALVDTARLDPRAAFTAGLLRSIGKTALNRLAGESVTEDRRPMGIADWEMAYLGLTNCDAAAVLLRAWRFPAETVAGIRDHYLIGAKPGGRLAQLLNVAAGMAARCGFGLAGEAEYLEISPEKYAAAHLTEATVNDAVVRTLYAFNSVRRVLTARGATP